MSRIVGSEKWGYARVISEMLARHQADLAAQFPILRGSLESNNLHVRLRNELVHLIGDIHGRFQVVRKYGVLLPVRLPFRGDQAESRGSRFARACAICGESRAVQTCHIKPAKFNGASHHSNILHLCPTHHFLFDHTRLSREEFAQLTLAEKASDAVDFFELVYRPAMEMFWRYGAYRFRGCYSCGGLDFDFVATRMLYGAGVGLRCRGCSEVMAPWDPGSPIHEGSAQHGAIASTVFMSMNTEEREAMYAECEAEVRSWIEANLQPVASTGERVKPIEFGWL